MILLTGPGTDKKVLILLDRYSYLMPKPMTHANLHHLYLQPMEESKINFSEHIHSSQAILKAESSQQ